MALTGNKGEWSEIYTLIKLLGDGKVYAGDANLKKLTVFYQILSIIRQENEQYEYKPDSTRQIVIIDKNGNQFARIPMSKFIHEAKDLLSAIKNGKQSTFSIPSTEAFMNTIGCTKLKAPSKDKADIHIVIHDSQTEMAHLLGFSIKSQLGKRSTLINPGRTTNIVYRIENKNMTDAKMNHVNNMNNGDKMDLIGRVRWLKNNGCRLIYDHFENDVLKNNMMMVDTILPDIIQRMLLFFYETDARTVNDLLKEVEQENFMNFDLNQYPLFYQRKVANLLVDAALGMVPKTKWHGKYDATGGYLIVKEDGDILCYHFYNRNLFEDYLLNNTDFTTPGKHEQNNFGIVYKQNNHYYMNLELQVRFLQ